MRRRLLWMGGKGARPVAVGVMAAALALAAMPASAQDPFARYNTELNADASEASQRADAPEPVATAKTDDAVGLPGGAELRAAGPASKWQAAKKRVEELLPIIEPILRKAGVPVSLAAVVVVESGGDPMALSPKGARGLWQLMPGTAREYGLVVRGETDQRLDVALSTRAAAEYLRDLHAEFGSWKLALAAYNAGDKAVQRAMARTGGVGFVAARRDLPLETQHYVPEVMHALGWFGGTALSPGSGQPTAQEVAYATGR